MTGVPWQVDFYLGVCVRKSVKGAGPGCLDMKIEKIIDSFDGSRLHVYHQHLLLKSLV